VAIPQDRVLSIVLRGLTSQEKLKCRVILDTIPKTRGESVQVGRREMRMPNDGYFVFVDLIPDANWGHAVAYFLIDSETGAFERIDDQFPPFSGDPPDEFVVALER
jgi:hypothetical protein